MIAFGPQAQDEQLRQCAFEMKREFAVGFGGLKHGAVDQAAQCIRCLQHTVGVLKLMDQRSDLGAKELCRKHGVSDATFYKWRSKYGGMEVSDAKKLKALEAENTKLKKLLAEQMMRCTAGYRAAMSREWMSQRSRRCCDRDLVRHWSEDNGRALLRPGSRRSAVAWVMTEKRYNQKRACALAGIDPRVYRRTSKRPADTDLRDRLKDLSSERRRFGYRRLHILLKREGWQVNWKKLYRIYREEGLTVRKRPSHRNMFRLPGNG